MHILYILVSITTYLVSLALSLAITGIQGGVNPTTGERPSRPRFSDLSQSGPAFDLFVQALRQFQAQNQSTLLSYYQVAGIHGHPYIEWDGAQGIYKAGYCTHGSILFPMWHRPYLALYEQILWQNVQGIAESYPASQRAQYQRAALTFRIPYWDWAFNATMPDALNEPHISVNTPQGSMNLVNPLYNYTFHPQPSALDFPSSSPLAKYHSTVRYPDASGNSQPGKSNAQLQANAEALHDLTYQLIAEQSDYAPFSNTAYSDGRDNNYNSIENMHNAIHSLVGQTGHIAIIPYSSFDPIFWLHHANVDRLISIWQAIYPNSFAISQVDQDGTYTNAPGGIENEQSPLTPFHSISNRTFYTSASARYTRHFGYTYPEVEDWGINATQLSSNVRRIINTLYNPGGGISSRSRRPKAMRRRDNNDTSTFLNTATEVNESVRYQYCVNIRVDKSALNESFLVHFFLGSIPSNPTLWATSPTLVASQSILYYPPSIASSATNRTIYGQIPVTHALLRPSPSLLSLHPNHTIPHLKAHLGYRIQLLHPNSNSTLNLGRESAILAKKLNHSLKLFVVGREVLREARGDQFPVYGPWIICWKIVSRKNGT